MDVRLPSSKVLACLCATHTDTPTHTRLSIDREDYTVGTASPEDAAFAKE